MVRIGVNNRVKVVHDCPRCLRSALLSATIVLALTGCAAPTSGGTDGVQPSDDSAGAEGSAAFAAWPADVPFTSGTLADRDGFTNGCTALSGEDFCCEVSLLLETGLVAELRGTYVDAGFAEIDRSGTIAVAGEYTRGTTNLQLTEDTFDNPGGDFILITLVH